MASNNVPDYVEPVLQPVKGVVQPPVVPPPNKPHRHTNQLEYLSKNVTKVMFSEECRRVAWPFYHPVDAEFLNIPDYHVIVKHPMDLCTIKNRLKNYYYYSSKECIQDFNTMFMNCYIYNKPGEEIITMAETLERVLHREIAGMPKEEIELPIPPRASGQYRASGKEEQNTNFQANLVDPFSGLQLTQH